MKVNTTINSLIMKLELMCLWVCRETARIMYTLLHCWVQHHLI